MNTNCKCNTKIDAKDVDGITIVIIPAQLGTSKEGELYAPQTCKYTNTIVKYLADGKVYLYDKVGNWAYISDTDIAGSTIDSVLSLASANAVENRVVTRAINSIIDDITALTDDLAEEVNNRKDADTALDTDIAAEAASRIAADEDIRASLLAEIAALTSDLDTTKGKLNKVVLSDLQMRSDAAAVTFVEDKVNISTGETSQERAVIPAATATSAGTLTAAGFLSIRNSQEQLEALLGGAVAIDGIPESPLQDALTDLWKEATGRSEIINRAVILDTDNNLVWTYYSNTQTWYPAPAGGEITIQPFTNEAAGSIQGSTADGAVSADNGRGYVNGWTELKNDVSEAKTDLGSLTTTVDDLGDDLAELSEDVMNIDGMVAEISADVTMAKNDISTLQGTTSSLQSSVATNTSNISSLRSDVNTAKTNITSLQSDMSTAKTDISGLKTTTTNLSNNKVDKVSGKQLSTNDYTTTEKNKLASIASGAQTNVQSDWNITDTGSDAFIKNKPALKTVATTGSYNDLTDKPTIPSGQVNSDWNATTGVAQIKNKPTLATVATSGSYTDLSNKPTIPAAQVNADWSATSGKAQILNKPTIPTVNNATLTIQKNGTNVATFTANSASNATANITVPVITLQTTDPGEGSTLAANNFIAVYQ